MDDVYRSLSHFATTMRDAQRHINEKISEKHGRDMSVVYYDVTNFYFETDDEDCVRKKGKDGKPATEGAEFMIKTRIVAREINVTMQSGKTEKKIVYERQVVFWSRKHADKARKDREKSLKKALDLIADPAKYNAQTSKGAARYVKNLPVDKKTGEIIEKDGRLPCFDFAKLAEEEKYDGYYAIVTSEMHMAPEQIIDTYRGLWEIEESFRISKGELEARPVHVRLKDRIEAHFLTCFIALTILRILQKKTGRAYSAEKIVDCLNRISCSNERDNLWLFDYRSEISDAVGAATGIDFTKKRMRLGEIKSAIGAAKAR